MLEDYFQPFEDNINIDATFFDSLEDSFLSLPPPSPLIETVSPLQVVNAAPPEAVSIPPDDDSDSEDEDNQSVITQGNHDAFHTISRFPHHHSDDFDMHIDDDDSMRPPRQRSRVPGPNHPDRIASFEKELTPEIIAIMNDPNLTAKERRQLRNKISARNFRQRKKEYIKTLEDENQGLREDIDDLSTQVRKLEIRNSSLVKVNLELKRTLSQNPQDTPATSLPPILTNSCRSPSPASSQHQRQDWMQSRIRVHMVRVPDLQDVLDRLPASVARESAEPQNLAHSSSFGMPITWGRFWDVVCSHPSASSASFNN